MVYCTKCGKENEDSAKFCVVCGAYLYSRDKERKEGCFGPKRYEEEECFGLPYGTTIIGIIFGIFIIIVGLTLLLGFNVERWFGPVIAIIIGVLIIAGAIYKLSRR